MAESISKNLGVVTAYGMAVQGGYTGTKQQFYEILGNIDLHRYEDYISQDVSLNVQEANMHYHFGTLSGFAIQSIVDSDWECTFKWTSAPSGCTMSLPANVNDTMVSSPEPGKQYMMSIVNRVAVGINVEAKA